MGNIVPDRKKSGVSSTFPVLSAELVEEEAWWKWGGRGNTRYGVNVK